MEDKEEDERRGTRRRTRGGMRMVTGTRGRPRRKIKRKKVKGRINLFLK